MQGGHAEGMQVMLSQFLTPTLKVGVMVILDL